MTQGQSAIARHTSNATIRSCTGTSISTSPPEGRPNVRSHSPNECLIIKPRAHTLVPVSYFWPQTAHGLECKPRGGSSTSKRGRNRRSPCLAQHGLTMRDAKEEMMCILPLRTFSSRCHFSFWKRCPLVPFSFPGHAKATEPQIGEAKGQPHG